MKHTRRSKASHRAPSKWPSHLVIPDTQCKPGVPLDHLKWLSNFIEEKRPSTIIHLGDATDMHSLSRYSIGRVEAEGCRYVDDIANIHEAMGYLTSFRKRDKQYKPKMVLTTGNHEQRIALEAESNPKMIGKIKLSDLEYERFGWRVAPYLDVVTLDSISYSHFFVGGVMGRPVSSAAALLRARHCSATMGHVQRVDCAVQPFTQHIGLFAGIFYQHDELYLTSQGQDTKRGVWLQHEVRDGTYDISFISLDFLRRRYS